MPGSTTVDYLNGEVPVAGATQKNGDGPTTHEFTSSAPSQETKGTIECDVLVVGAGFSGITAIDRFRRLGKSVKCFESGTDFGGVWYWNRYPGARVDSEAPFYQLNIPEVYHKWTFSERFPGHRELRRYIAHIDSVLNLRKDTYFNARVNDASWNADKQIWTIKTQQGHTAQGKYLVLTTGLLHRTYTPDFPGLGDYKGEIYHSGAWKEDYNGKGKKVALIGAGATAVQITQELGKEADELTVLLRRPSYCLPMQQRRLTEAEQTSMMMFYPALFKAGRDSAVGFPVSRRTQGVLDVSNEERDDIFQRLLRAGGFNFSLGGFSDTALKPEANKVVYDYWASTVRARLTDPAKQEIMAPKKAPYYFGTKRSPLEQDYYEVLNQPNVFIHDLSKVPLKSFVEKGLEMADGSVHEYDTIVLATGFDSFTGSLTQMGLKNKDGIDIKDLWQDGVKTYLGLTVPGFPNMFMAYTPQAPTALSNGPTIIEAQVETIVDIIGKLESEGGSVIEAQTQAEKEWKASLNAMAQHTLFPYTDSWWNGSNVPGKKAELMSYIGGINNYEAQCRATMSDWKGFDVISAKA